MSEGRKRDAAMQRVASNPSNNYELLVIAARRRLLRYYTGQDFTSGQLRRDVMERNPNLEPMERRVWGPIMRRLETEKLIVRRGVSTRERSHRGMATEWRRTSA